MKFIVYVDLIHKTTITEGWEVRVDEPNGFMFSVLLEKWHDINSKQTDTLRRHIFESLEPQQVIKKGLEKNINKEIKFKI